MGVDLFALKYYLDRVVPHRPFLAPKTRHTELPNGEDHIPLHSLILTDYWSVMDGQICRSIYSACKASFAAHCKNEVELIML